MSAAKRPSALRAAADRTASTTPAPGATAIITTPIRTTVDLDRALWADVKAWMSTEQVASRRQVKSANVFRALLSLLVEDPAVAQAVRERLHAVTQ